jgi:phage terminase large subunit-like protein
MNLTLTFLNKEEYIEYCWKAARDYCEGVQDGSIVCNENIRLAVKRHELDLLRTDLEWRPEAVEKVFKFFSYIYVDKNKQFILQPFQAFIILALFGLFFKGTNTRKYLYAFLFIGRKNGKTTFSAALQLYFMLADGVSFPSSILVAGSQNQANDTSFRALKEIIISSPALRDRLEAMQSNRIIFKDRSRYGWCKTVPAIEDRLEGLNPTSCILDEIHTYKDAQKFNVIKNALGTKENPMLFLISTAGYGKDSFCAQLVETGRNVLRGVSKDDRFFYLLYELEEGDDINDEVNWIKANPALGTILDLKLFRDQFNTNKTIPSLLNDFVTKRFNIFLEENSQWIPNDVLIDSFIEFNDDELKELPCYVGVDLSSTRDLTSVVCLFDAGDRFYVKPYFFFVNNTNNSLRKGNIDILQWVRDGYIIQCNTPTIDYELVKAHILSLNSKYKVVGLYYDPWHFDRLLNEMKQTGVWCVPISPGVRNFDGAIRFTESIIYEKKINIYYNKCLIWNFRNVVIWKDMNGNMKPNKNESADAIDGVISLLNAISGYLQQNTNANALFMKSLNI